MSCNKAVLKPLAGRFLYGEHGLAIMDWITDTIAIGTFLEARSHTLRVDAGIRSIICLDAVLRDPDEHNLEVGDYEVIDFVDGPGNDPRVFDQAVRLVGVLSEQSPKLLVHCRAGRSRSVVVVAGYLMQERHWSCDEAIAFIGRRRDIQLTPGIEGLLRSVRQQT